VIKLDQSFEYGLISITRRKCLISN